MKKILCILILIFPAGFYTNAQQFNAGISGGFVASDVYASDIYDYDTDFHKAGFIFGGLVSTALSPNTTLRLELNYIQKGTQQPADSTGNGYYKFSFNYLEFPLIFKWRFNFNVAKKPINRFDFQTGISVGKLISHNSEGDNFYSYAGDSYLNKTDVSLLAGLGYNFSPHFNFSFRYSNSLIPVFKRNSPPPFYFTSTLNNGNNLVWHFIFQYMFGADKNTPAPPVEENNN